MKDRLLTILTSKTFWGAVCVAGAWLSQQQHIGLTEILQAGGTVLTASGIRDAIHTSSR